MSEMPQEPADDLKIFEKYSAEDVVRCFLQLRDRRQKDAKAFKETIEELDTAMEALQSAAHLMMKLTKQKNLVTDAGTAYQSPWESFRVEDPDLWHQWVRETQNWDMYTNAVSKDAMRDYLEKTKTEVKDPVTGKVAYHYHFPPGIKYESGIDINFRSS